MTHQIEDQIFKYATKEDGIGLLNLVKSNLNMEINTENWRYNL